VLLAGSKLSGKVPKKLGASADGEREGTRRDTGEDRGGKGALAEGES